MTDTHTHIQPHHTPIIACAIHTDALVHLVTLRARETTRYSRINFAEPSARSLGSETRFGDAIKLLLPDYLLHDLDLD